MPEPSEPDEAPHPWPRRLTTSIGKRIRHFRESQDPKISARELSDRTSKLGHRVEYQVIANMETGRRTSISVHEILVIASALGVPPALLVVPLGTGTDTELLPDEPSDPWECYQWFVGDSRDQTSLSYRGLINAYERHDAAVRRLLHRMRMNEDVNGALDAVIARRAEIRAQGWHMPRLPEGGISTVAEASALRKVVELAELDEPGLDQEIEP